MDQENKAKDRTENLADASSDTGRRHRYHEGHYIRGRAAVKAAALRDIMLKADRVLIMGHQIADMDSFGAAVGVFCIARHLGRETHIVLGTVTTSLKPMVDCFTAEPGYPGDMIISAEKGMEITDAGTALIVVDTDSPSYTECEKLLYMAGTVAVFDHHRFGPETIEHADLTYIEPYASSACELIAAVMQNFDEEIELSDVEADAVYSGILLDTNNFVTKTGVRTFEAAAYLKRCGADTTRVRKLMRNDLNAYKARADAIVHTEVYRGAYAISICPADNIESPTVACAQAANELLNIIGIKASFVMTEYEGKVYISARSIDEIDVQEIMVRLGGGGHISSAGAQLTGCTVDEARQTIVDMLDEMIDKENE